MDAVCRLIASLDLETLMPIIPCRCFIGIDHRFLRDRGANERSNLAFRIENCGDGIAVSHHDNPALAALVPGSRGRVLTMALAASRGVLLADQLFKSDQRAKDGSSDGEEDKGELDAIHHRTVQT